MLINDISEAEIPGVRLINFKRFHEGNLLKTDSVN
jgi:hypothetical protein